MQPIDFMDAVFGRYGLFRGSLVKASVLLFLHIGKPLLGVVLGLSTLWIQASAFERDGFYKRKPLDSLSVEELKEQLALAEVMGRSDPSFIANLKDALAIAEVKRIRAEYLSAYEHATSLEKILAFEKKYAGNDPDGLIPQLAATKEHLILKRYRAMYENAKTSSELRKFIEEYSAFDPDSLVIAARQRIPQVEKQERLALQLTERAAKQATVDQNRKRLQYIQKLQKYVGNIIPESPQAYQIVSRYNIDCRHGDGRVLPLLHTLYAAIAQIDDEENRMVFYIQNRGQAVRIVGQLYRHGKLLGEPRIYYQINEWGELNPVGIRYDAVLSACAGSHGPIWLMPGEPGY